MLCRNATIKKCKESDRIEENHNGIRILNWMRYQSEYERQKPYRQAKGGPNRFVEGKFGHMVKR